MTITKQYQILNTKSRNAKRVFMESLPRSIAKNLDFRQHYYGSACVMAQIIGSKKVALDKELNTDAATQLAVAEQQLLVTLRYVSTYFATAGVGVSLRDELMTKLHTIVQFEKDISQFKNQHREALVESY